MSDTLDLGDGITLIDAHYRHPGIAAFYLIVSGGRAAFIDTGTGRALPRAIAALRSHGLGPEQVDFVIPTHVHLDHAGGAGAMMAEFPNARLVIHPRGARHLIDPTKLIAGVIDVYGEQEVREQFGDIPPIPAARVIEAPDNFMLDLDGRPLRFLDTPGHARHHFCVWDERSGSLFAGDTFGVSYRALDTERGAFVFPTTTPVQFEPEALHVSVDRLAALRPRQILLTHFGRVTEIDRLASDLHELIDAFCQMASAAPDSGMDRQARLVEGQRNILLPRLRQHGCRMSDAEIDRLIGGDYRLNAQGLAVWLDRRGRG